MSDIKNAIDERLALALEASNYRITMQHQKEISKLKLQNNLVYSTNGGIFVANRELISFVSTLISHKKSDAIILDSNDNPIKIDNLEEFLEELIGLYYESMNDHLVEYDKIKTSRTTTKVVNW